MMPRRMRHLPCLALLLAALPLVVLPVAAQPLAELPETVVTAAPIEEPAAASVRLVPAVELQARPIARTGEMLEAAPGLVVMQHSGEGKANQYFLRGFNLDHGTDLAISIDGMPVNMPTHAHGQGYADTSFIIPELLGGMLVRKGPYFADLGDFATAGALRLDLLDTLDRPFVQGTTGSFGYWRGLAAGAQALGAGTLLAALEAAAYDGPWQHGDRLSRFNALLRFSQGTQDDGLTLTGMSYAGRWHATDQVPARGVSQGMVERLGALDPTDGGEAQRHSLSGRWSQSGDWGVTRIEAFAIRSTLDLYNNFTYWLDQPDRGDQFAQRDRRWILGLHASQTMPGELFGRPLETRLGLQTRYDDIRLGLYRSEARAIFATTREDAVSQGTAALYAESTLRWTEWLRTTLGLRGDAMGGRVSSDLAANSGSARDAMVSPKGGLVLGPWRETEIFLNAGSGFHSNDLRGATISTDPNDRLTPLSRVPLLVRARGAEVGLRNQSLPGLDTRIAAFVLTLGSEILFLGDAGTTEASRPSRRVGVEWTNRWQLQPWLALDLDAAATQARFTDDAGAGRHVPGAPTTVLAAGLVFGDGPGWFGAARLRYFGPRPLTEDDSIRSAATTLVNGRIGYRLENGIRLQLDGFNLLHSHANQVEYFYTSRLRGEPAVGVADRHYHPVEPLAVRFTVTVPL